MCITAVEQLAHLLLKENLLTFTQHSYRQVVGGAMGLPFTLT